GAGAWRLGWMRACGPLASELEGPWPKSRSHPTNSGVYGRMNWSTGWLFCSAVIESAKAGLAALLSAGSFFIRSLRSLLGPGRKSTRERDRTVGRALATSGRRAAKNGASFGATGFDVLTRVVRSPSVARRLTNVVLAFR